MSEVLSLTVAEGGEGGADKTGASDHPQYQNALGKLQRGLEARCEQVRQNPNLSGPARQDKINEHWHEAQEAYHQLREYYEGQLEADVEEAEKGLFEVDKYSTASVRDAYEIVYSATKGFDSGERDAMETARQELERYAERARRTGDTGLQHAVGHIAIERGIADIWDAYLSASKERQRAWEGYNQARRKQDSFKTYRVYLASGMGGLVKPAEIRS